MSTRKKSKLFLLSPGPNYNLEYSFKNRCEKLSEHFRGLVLTSGQQFGKEQYGNFTVICLKDPLTKSFISSLGFIFYGLVALFSAKLKGDRLNLLATYDPLKTGLIGALLSTLVNTRFVVEINGDYTQDVIYSEIKSLRKRKFKKWLMLSVEKFVLDRANAVKLLHDRQIDVFLPLKKKPHVERFPDYVNSEVFRNLGEKKEILFAGFPFMVKGVDILIKAFKQVADKHSDWQLKILGWYPDKTLLLSHIDNHPQIFYHPPVDRAEMQEHMGKCGIFVLPSRTEAMGRVLIEAMAASKPRVGSNVGGIPTVIERDVDGLLFEPEDVDGLAKILDQLMLDENQRKNLGMKARERYEKEFKPDMYFRRLNDFYKVVLSEK